MIDDLEIPADLGGRLRRHVAGQLRPLRHRHFELEMNLVVSGRATYLVGDRRYDLTSGSVVWLFRTDEHLLVEESRDHVLWWAVFRPIVVSQVFGIGHPLAADHPSGDQVRNVDALTAHRLAAIFEELSSPPATRQAFNAGLAYLLASAWETYERVREPTASVRFHPSVDRAVRLIVDDPSDTSVQSLARQVGLSPAHLSRLFSSQVGRSITRFRNEQRLERFLRLRATDGSGTSMMALAMRAGFGSYAQFHRVVVAATGRPPTALPAGGASLHDSVDRASCPVPCLR